MFPAALLRNALRISVPLSVVLTVYLYLYPVFSACAFPLPRADGKDVVASSTAFRQALTLHWPFGAKQEAGDASPGYAPAPFRLLALGDPQIEGDTSIPTTYLGTFPHIFSMIRHATFQTEHWCFRERVRQMLHDLVDVYLEDIPYLVESARKRFDLLGNDFYLAHIYRTLHWWSRPTHVSVLGDLVGSQWIDDAEFDKRGRRFWDRVFRGGQRVPDDLARAPAAKYDLAGYLGPDGPAAAGTGGNATQQADWPHLIINVAGNHDIGYAGDLNLERMARFERVYGRANYELRFELPVADAALNATVLDEERNADSDRLPPELRVVVLNDMNLDTPALSTELQDQTYAFVNSVIGTASAVEYQGHMTVLLTHIPLYKPAGVCVDAPFFDFFGDWEDGVHGVKEQYQLSADASKGFLEGIFGMSGDQNAAGRGRGRKGVILNGHDHEGCDTWHYINQTEELEEGAAGRAWRVRRWEHARADGLPAREAHPGLREITVRSMMGDFGGSAGLFSAWFDYEAWEWRYEFATCALGTQHWWWLVHFLDLFTVLGLLGYAALKAVGASGAADVEKWEVDVVTPLKQLWAEITSSDDENENQTAAVTVVEKTKSVGNGEAKKATTKAPP